MNAAEEFVKGKWEKLTAFTNKKEIKDYLWNELVYRYSGPHRFYHNLNHVAYIFSLFDSYLNNIKNNTSDKLVLSGTVQVKKDKGNNQNPVMQWLTDGNKNSHFNADVETDQQIYVISESGVLYAVLEKGVLPSVIDQVLKQADVKPQIYSGLKQ